jgi:hypothetical protein
MMWDKGSEGLEGDKQYVYHVVFMSFGKGGYLSEFKG